MWVLAMALASSPGNSRHHIYTLPQVGGREGRSWSGGQEAPRDLDLEGEQQFSLFKAFRDSRVNTEKTQMIHANKAHKLHNGQCYFGICS